MSVAQTIICVVLKVCYPALSVSKFTNMDRLTIVCLDEKYHSAKHVAAYPGFPKHMGSLLSNIHIPATNNLLLALAPAPANPSPLKLERENVQLSGGRLYTIHGGKHHLQFLKKFRCLFFKATPPSADVKAEDLSSSPLSASALLAQSGSSRFPGSFSDQTTASGSSSRVEEEDLDDILQFCEDCHMYVAFINFPKHRCFPSSPEV